MKTQKKSKKVPARRQISAAEALCDARLSLGHVTLALDDLMKESGLSATAAKWQ